MTFLLDTENLGILSLEFIKDTKTLFFTNGIKKTELCSITFNKNLEGLEGPKRVSRCIREANEAKYYHRILKKAKYEKNENSKNLLFYRSGPKNIQFICSKNNNTESYGVIGSFEASSGTQIVDFANFSKNHLVAISEDGWLSFCNYSPILAQKASKEGEKNLKISAQKIELFSEEKLVSCAACNNQPLVLVSSMMRGQKQARIFVFQKDQNSKKLSISSTLDLRNEAFSNVSNSFIKEMSISGSLEQGKCSILAFTHAGGFELLGFELKQKSSSNQLILTRNGTIEGYHTRSVLNSEIFDQKFWSVDGNGCLFSTKQSIFM